MRRFGGEQMEFNLYSTIEEDSECMKYYKSEIWKRKKQIRLRIDGYRCTQCGATTNLQVHHKFDDYSNFMKEDPEKDLITLCKSCHEKTPSALRKKIINDGEYDFIVSNCKLGKYQGGNIIPECDQLIVEISILDSHGNLIKPITEYLKIHNKTSWKIGQFKKSIFPEGKSMSVMELFESCVGKRGRLTIETTSLNGKCFNRVGEFLRKQDSTSREYKPQDFDYYDAKHSIPF